MFYDKNIQQKYEKYLDGINNENLSPTEKNEIAKILEIAKALNLFEIEIGERIILPGEKELSRINAFEIKGDVKKFLELFKQSKKELNKAQQIVKPNDTLRIRTTMSVLQLLNEYGFEISDENLTNLYRKINNDNSLTSKDAKENINLLDLINSSFTENTRLKIIDELDMDLEELEQFKIYSEFDYARQSFTATKKSIRSIFSVYSIEEIRKTGILKENGKFISAIDKNGFVLNKAPELFRKINIYTGTRFGLNQHDIDGYNLDGYDADGYDRDGYDITGFKRDSGINKYGFRRDGFNTETLSYLDKNGFDINGIYWAPNPDFPNNISKRINTHKPVNEYNFNRDGIWYTEDEKGDLVPVGLEDEFGFKAFETISKYNFRRDGFNVNTQTMYDIHGFDINKIHMDTNKKYDPHGFDIDGINKETKTKLDKRKFDIDGFYYKENKRGIMVNTYKFYDENGRDIDGLDINGKDINGVNHFSFLPDKRGFNQKKIHMKTKTIVDVNGLDYDGIYWEERGGKLLKTKSKFGKNGLTKDGIDKRNFRVKDGWNILTNSPVDENNWDINGFFWKKNREGVLVNTGSKYNPQGFNVYGINKYGFNKNGKYEIRTAEYGTGIIIREQDTNPYGFYSSLVNKNGTKYDNYGFDIDGIHKNTKLPVNEYGFNRDGYYCIKNKKGVWKSTKRKYNPRGFDIDKRYHEKDAYGKRVSFVYR